MSEIAEQVGVLRRHLDHLHGLRHRALDAEALRRDLSLQNDVLFSLLVCCQRVIDLAGDLSARRGLYFQSYPEALRNLMGSPEFTSELLNDLKGLPGLRDVLVFGYLNRDLERVVASLGRLEAVEHFTEIVRWLTISGVS
jgi:uncharacterized protein YutE (UPF0331/DUF86 family)